jgi:hypothetical protein
MEDDDGQDQMDGDMD